MYQLDTSARCLFIVLLFVTNKASTPDDVLDTREAMAIEAQKALTASFVAYETDSNNDEKVCADVGGPEMSSLPDVCMPDSEYTTTYTDTREKGGRNHPKNLSPNPKFGDVRTGDYLGYKIQPKTPASRKVYNELCASKTAGASFKSNAVGDNIFGPLASSTSWQYFGAQYTGMFAQYPASIKTQCWCDSYDPRYRPWYSAAITGPKDMILILDTSGSMSQKVKVSNINNDGEEILVEVERLQVMKDAALALLKTITFVDFVQIVHYNTEATAHGSKLVRGTTSNKHKLEKFINGLEAGGSTCGKCGFAKSFDIFQASTSDQSTSGCERIISFLTDGMMNEKNWVDGWMANKVSQLTGPAPHIFTYALGSGASTEIPAKLACKYNGWFTKVEKEDPASLKFAMVRYFEYFARRIPEGNSTLIPRWTEFYLDASGQGKMTTVALPVYHSSGDNTRIFRGVIGIDVLAEDFGTSLDDSALAVRLQQRSSQCIAYDFGLEDDAQVIGNYTSSENINEGMCVVKPTNHADSKYIPTGATESKVRDGFCTEDSSWVGLVILLVLFCCCCACFVSAFNAIRKRTCNRQVHPRGQLAQQNHAMHQQHVGGSIYYQNQNVRVVTPQEGLQTNMHVFQADHVMQQPPVFMAQQAQISANQPQQQYSGSFVQQQPPIMQQHMFIPLAQQQQQPVLVRAENVNHSAYKQG
eukprot:g394.t1